jgi:hypothetical protein
VSGTTLDEHRADDRFLDPRPFPDAPPAFIVRMAIALRRTMLRLTDAIFPAELVMFERAMAATDTHCIGLAASLGITDLLEAGPLTADEIAAKLSLHGDSTHRFLRALAVRGVYTLSDDGKFSNNRLSRALRSGLPSRTRQWAMYISSRANLAAWGALDHAVRRGGSPFESVHGRSVWSWFDDNPLEREHFAHAMMGLTFLDAPVVAKVYPFSEVKTICDVGGGRGSLMSELLVRHPHLRGILCDAAGVLESARSLLAARGVADRVELVPTNFFESVPAGADAYLMKNILHDWDDDRCRTILGAVRRAMSPRSRLIVVETLCEKNRADGVAPLADLQMMLVCDGGRERSREEFEQLFRACGFRLSRVFPYPTTSVLEAEPV